MADNKERAQDPPTISAHSPSLHGTIASLHYNDQDIIGLCCDESEEKLDNLPQDNFSMMRANDGSLDKNLSRQNEPDISAGETASEAPADPGASLGAQPGGRLGNYSISIVLPAHNEEVAISKTVQAVIAAVSQWTSEFEVIVVNDGSKDGTRAIVEEIAVADPRVRLINHEVNRGYGAALVSGFEALSNHLAFFMDSDGQFDIQDLARFLPLIEKYDGVLGYRIDRQDTWIRKLNAWGWKMLVLLVFKVRVRDVDCAFKLYRTSFFREHRLETRGAMINTEILYKFKRAGYTYTELGVRHLPRQGGRATGAKLSVIARAFRELFVFARKCKREERRQSQAGK